MRRRIFSYDEAVRLEVLREYQILDTPPEPNFDRIAKLAATIFALPICTLSLADTDRHWFKAHYGVDATEMPRRMSFCDEMLRQPDGLIVPDALADERFADAPVVVHAPYIRFYAGAPLVTPAGHRIGSLCVLDTKPHDNFSPEQMAILANLAGTSIELLEARSRNIQLVQYSQELAHLAGHDPLTGLPNRRMLQSRFDARVAAADASDELALLYVDLDRFKDVNDTLGHDLGDELLRLVSTRLRESLRQADIVARIGGDEFVVLLFGPKVRREADDVADRLLVIMNQPYLLRGRSLLVTVSIGMTFGRTVPGDRLRLEDLLRNADIGLHAAKSSGRNRSCCFEPHAGARPLAMGTRLAHADPAPA
jgi:diguanylate cyclase (GGDEF)-like protein